MIKTCMLGRRPSVHATHFGKSRLVPIKILLVEDNPDDAFLFAEYLDMLNGLQFHLVRCDTLAAARQRLAKEEVFDAVVLDLGLPDSVGLFAYYEIRALAPGLPILVYTGSDDHELSDAVTSSGGSYMVKQNTTWGRLAVNLMSALVRKRDNKLKDASSNGNDQQRSA